MQMRSVVVAGLLGLLLGNIGAARAQTANAPVSWADRVEPMNQRLVNRQHLTANVPATITVPGVPLTIGVAPNASTETLQAQAVLVDLTIISPRSSGYVSAWSSGPWPGTSQLNFVRSASLLTNLAFVQVAGDGTFQVMSSTDVDIVIDLVAGFPVAESAPVP